MFVEETIFERCVRINSKRCVQHSPFLACFAQTCLHVDTDEKVLKIIPYMLALLPECSKNLPELHFKENRKIRGVDFLHFLMERISQTPLKKFLEVISTIRGNGNGHIFFY